MEVVLAEKAVKFKKIPTIYLTVVYIQKVGFGFCNLWPRSPELWPRPGPSPRKIDLFTHN
jgi:hypothetical protein